MSYFLCVMGMVLIVEGLPYFAFPDKMKQFLAKLPMMPSSSMRACGLGSICIGLLLVFLARRLL
ncbi:MAG: DUF2065 domain-containing protein [Deltaproteobacteria bacterium]|nr:DUF2065 domain-containing protein [Deltaproteobacteria bacterium]